MLRVSTTSGEVLSPRRGQTCGSLTSGGSQPPRERCYPRDAPTPVPPPAKEDGLNHLGRGAIPATARVALEAAEVRRLNHLGRGAIPATCTVRGDAKITVEASQPPRERCYPRDTRICWLMATFRRCLNHLGRGAIPATLLVRREESRVTSQPPRERCYPRDFFTGSGDGVSRSCLNHLGRGAIPATLIGRRASSLKGLNHLGRGAIPATAGFLNHWCRAT